MAEEELALSPVPSPALTDHHKRKLEDLEVPAVPESTAQSPSEAVSDPESSKKDAVEEDNGGGDEFESKRPRLEANVNEPDGLGHNADLAAVQTHKMGLEQRSAREVCTRDFRSRGERESHDANRTRSSPVPPSRGCGPEVLGGTCNDPETGKRKNIMLKGDGDLGKKHEMNIRRDPKKKRTEVRDQQSVPSNAGHLFVDGVNWKDDADSFWDLSDPEAGWRVGMNMVGDHDTTRLLSQAGRMLTQSAAVGCCQLLSLVKALDIQGERARKVERELREEVAMLKAKCQRYEEDYAKLEIESSEKKKECVDLRKEADDQKKTYTSKVDGLRKDLDEVNNRYSFEVETGDQFLKSVVGKTLLTSTGEKAIEGYRASSAFNEDVLQRAIAFHDELILDCRNQLRQNNVSEDIVMMIEPSVLEPES